MKKSNPLEDQDFPKLSKISYKINPNPKKDKKKYSIKQFRPLEHMPRFFRGTEKQVKLNRCCRCLRGYQLLAHNFLKY